MATQTRQASVSKPGASIKVFRVLGPPTLQLPDQSSIFENISRHTLSEKPGWKELLHYWNHSSQDNNAFTSIESYERWLNAQSAEVIKSAGLQMFQCWQQAAAPIIATSELLERLRTITNSRLDELNEEYSRYAALPGSPIGTYTIEITNSSQPYPPGSSNTVEAYKPFDLSNTSHHKVDDSSNFKDTLLARLRNRGTLSFDGDNSNTVEPPKPFDLSDTSCYKIDDSSNFKDTILARLTSYNLTSGTLLFYSCEDKIFICSYNKTYFSLMPTLAAFRWADREPCRLYQGERLYDAKSENDDSCDEECSCFTRPKSHGKSSHPYCWLWRSDEKKEKQYFTASKGWGNHKGDLFLTLGWLVEENKENDFYQTTRYTCLINLSTTPISMWLAFDHLCKDLEGHVMALSTPQCKGSYNQFPIDNCLDEDASTETLGKGSLFNQDRGYLERPRPWNLAILYHDIKDWPSTQPAESLSTTKRLPAGFHVESSGDFLHASRVKNPREELALIFR